jgi:hypothetical protein
METIEKVKERPILFSTPMVQAIMEGRKTVTRRLNGWDDRVNQNPNNWIPVGSDPVYPGDREEENDINSYCDFQTQDTVWMALNKYPAQVGDILWVRETFYAYGYWCLLDGKWKFNDCTMQYDRHRYAENPPHEVNEKRNDGIGWYKRPSIFMPREVCRLKLEIVSIGVERLHDITEEDAIKEGVAGKCMC